MLQFVFLVSLWYFSSNSTDSCRFLGDQLRTVVSVLDYVVYERNFPSFDLVLPCVEYTDIFLSRLMYKSLLLVLLYCVCVYYMLRGDDSI